MKQTAKERKIRFVFKQYRDMIIMSEGIGKTYMILKEKNKWYEKIVPDFIIPNPSVLLRGIKTIKDAKYIIDDNTVPNKNEVR